MATKNPGASQDFSDCEHRWQREVSDEVQLKDSQLLWDQKRALDVPGDFRSRLPPATDMAGRWLNVCYADMLQKAFRADERTFLESLMHSNHRFRRDRRGKWVKCAVTMNHERCASGLIS